MRINHLKLHNFRNYPAISLDINSQIVFLEGMNGQGKTNLVEAVSVLALLKSFRVANYDLLINSSQKSFFIEGNFQSTTSKNINVKLSYQDKKKQIQVDDKKIKKFSDYWGMIPLVYLIPEEGEITAGSPSERRSFFDQFLCLISNEYFSALKNYLSVLKQKNNLLSEIKKNPSVKTLLPVYNQQIVEYADVIVRLRLNLLKSYQPIVSELVTQISPAITCCEFEYLSNIKTDNYKANLSNKLRENEQIEIIRGSSLYGPQKDDVVFNINGYNLRNFGSKGQHKIFLVALKLAQVKYMKSIIREYPIFILDDLFSEIDSEKCMKIAELLDSEIQTFITTCDYSKKNYFNPAVTQILNIENGGFNVRPS